MRPDGANKEYETIKADEFSSIEAHMQYRANDIRSLMDEVRTYADSLEMVVADELWPLPKYSEMLFIK